MSIKTVVFINKAVDPSLNKPRLNSNEGLVKRGLTSLVKIGH